CSRTGGFRHRFSSTQLASMAYRSGDVLVRVDRCLICVCLEMERPCGALSGADDQRSGNHGVTVAACEQQEPVHCLKFERSFGKKHKFSWMIYESNTDSSPLRTQHGESCLCSGCNRRLAWDVECEQLRIAIGAAYRQEFRRQLEGLARQH